MRNPADAKIECHGGPQDGELIRDRGLFFRVIAMVNRETGQPVPGSAGTYVQRSGVYQWEPDR